MSNTTVSLKEIEKKIIQNFSGQVYHDTLKSLNLPPFDTELGHQKNPLFGTQKVFCDANCVLGFKASECFTWLNIDLLTNPKCNSSQNKQGIRQICTCCFGRVCFSCSMENLTYQQRNHSCHISQYLEKKF